MSKLENTFEWGAKRKATPSQDWKPVTDKLRQDLDEFETSVTDFYTTEFLPLQEDEEQLKQEVNTVKSNVSTNTNNISSLRTIQDELVAQLKAAKLWNIRGSWDASTNYVIGDVVGLESTELLYVALKENTGVNPDGNLTTWFPISGVQQIDLSDYYNKTQVDALLEDIKNLIKSLSTKVDTNTTNISNLDAKVNTKADASEIQTIRTALDKKVDEDSMYIYAKKNEKNKFNDTNTFTGGVNIDGTNGLKIRDSNSKDSLWIYSERERTGATALIQEGDSEATTYYLRAGGPAELEDLVNKQYVDTKFNSIQIPTDYVTTNTEQTINANKIIHQSCTWVYRGSSLRLETTDGSSNIGFKNVGGKLVDLSNNQYVNVATDNTYASDKRNIFRKLPEVYSVSTMPTRDVELTTKKYVDNKLTTALTKLAEKLGITNEEISKLIEEITNE